MKSSPKSNEMPVSTGSKTPASGKKLVQARLPFKSLGGSVPPFSATNDTSEASSLAVSVDNRKRRPNDVDDTIRAAKLNRSDCKSSDNISLEAHEIMEISCDETTENDTETGSNLVKVSHTSESKENVCVGKRSADENDQIDVDRSETDHEDATLEPKAKQSLDFEKKSSESRKSKRTNESSLIKIKLPISKKSKDAAKKMKKQKKMTNDDIQNEMETDETEAEKPNEKAAADTNAQDDQQPDTENDMEVDVSAVLTEKEAIELDKSKSDDDGNVLNDSVVSNPPEQCATPTNHKLTPKQNQRRLESEKKKQEKEQARLERERKQQEEKEMRQREKEEKELQKKREREEKGTVLPTLIITFYGMIAFKREKVQIIKEK